MFEKHEEVITQALAQLSAAIAAAKADGVNAWVYFDKDTQDMSSLRVRLQMSRDLRP